MIWGRKNKSWNSCISWLPMGLRILTTTWGRKAKSWKSWVSLHSPRACIKTFCGSCVWLLWYSYIISIPGCSSSPWTLKFDTVHRTCIEYPINSITETQIAKKIFPSFVPAVVAVSTCYHWKCSVVSAFAIKWFVVLAYCPKVDFLFSQHIVIL